MAYNKYLTHVKPRLDEVEIWLKNGATQVQVAKSLEISERSLRDYLRKYPEFAEAYKRGLTELVTELRGALITKAMGFVRTTRKPMKCKTIDYVEGKKLQEREEVIFYDEEEYFPPDVAALNLALKNYDKANWANDPQQLALKKEELELKRKHLEEEW